MGIRDGKTFQGPTTARPAYSRAARLRFAMADKAASISDTTRGMVQTTYDEASHAGEWVEQALRVAREAEHLLTLAIAYEYRQGTSWTEIGERLGISKQAAHERYADRVRQHDEAMTVAWILGDPAHAEGSIDPADLEHLDRWARARAIHEDDGHADQMVSAGLPVMDTSAQVGMVVAAGALMAGDRADRTANRPRLEATPLAELELGYARRKVEVYASMAAQEAERPGSTGTSPDQLDDLLAGARARLAEIETSESGRE